MTFPVFPNPRKKTPIFRAQPNCWPPRSPSAGSDVRSRAPDFTLHRSNYVRPIGERLFWQMFKRCQPNLGVSWLPCEVGFPSGAHWKVRKALPFFIGSLTVHNCPSWKEGSWFSVKSISLNSLLRSHLASQAIKQSRTKNPAPPPFGHSHRPLEDAKLLVCILNTPHLPHPT